MSRVNRLACALALSMLALTPAAAAALPTPSPSLDKVLVAPPAGFTPLSDAAFHGSFTAHDYAVNTDSTQPDEIEKTLAHDGFVDGYKQSWIDAVSQRAILEVVMAFAGARGARSWLIAAEAGDKADPNYIRAESISGVSPYYGAHFKNPANNTFGDIFTFVKGNDVFIVAVASAKDDGLPLATTQTRAQHDQAPNETIPSSQWPENATKASGSFPLPAIGIIGVLIVLAVVAALIVAMRRRPGSAPAAVPEAAGTVAAPGAMGSPPAAGVQMSTDGEQWWDGQTWRDAASEAPPAAQRSSDGALWWDGQSWRPVPRSAQPDPEAPTG
jgi:hypothetical protein